MRWLAILVALAACGAQPDAVERHGCDLALDPEPALAEVTEKWAADWTAALPECAIGIEPGGVPVVIEDDLVSSSGGESCAQTEMTLEGITLEIRVDTTPPRHCVSWGYSLGHEIGHAIAGRQGHAEGSDSLMSSPIESGRVHTVDAASIQHIRALLAD